MKPYNKNLLELELKYRNQGHSSGLPTSKEPAFLQLFHSLLPMTSFSFTIQMPGKTIRIGLVWVSNVCLFVAQESVFTCWVYVKLCVVSSLKYIGLSIHSEDVG